MTNWHISWAPRQSQASCGFRRFDPRKAAGGQRGGQGCGKMEPFSGPGRPRNVKTNARMWIKEFSDKQKNRADFVDETVTLEDGQKGFRTKASLDVAVVDDRDKRAWQTVTVTSTAHRRKKDAQEHAAQLLMNHIVHLAYSMKVTMVDPCSHVGALSPYSSPAELYTAHEAYLPPELIAQQEARERAESSSGGASTAPSIGSDKGTKWMANANAFTDSKRALNGVDGTDIEDNHSSDGDVGFPVASQAGSSAIPILDNKSRAIPIVDGPQKNDKATEKRAKRELRKMMKEQAKAAQNGNGHLNGNGIQSHRTELSAWFKPAVKPLTIKAAANGTTAASHGGGVPEPNGLATLPEDGAFNTSAAPFEGGVDAEAARAIKAALGLGLGGSASGAHSEIDPDAWMDEVRLCNGGILMVLDLNDARNGQDVLGHIFKHMQMAPDSHGVSKIIAYCGRGFRPSEFYDVARMFFVDFRDCDGGRGLSSDVGSWASVSNTHISYEVGAMMPFLLNQISISSVLFWTKHPFGYTLVELLSRDFGIPVQCAGNIRTLQQSLASIGRNHREAQG